MPVSHEHKLCDDIWLRNERGHYSLVGLWPRTANEAVVDIGDREQLVALATVLAAWIPFNIEERKRELAHYERLAKMVDGCSL